MEDPLHQEVLFRRNRRNCEEHYVLVSHISIDDLKRIYWNQSNWRNQYLEKSVEPNETSGFFVPRYPCPVEFHVSRITHVTYEEKLYDIQKCGGFGGSTSGFLYWGLSIGPDETFDAEQRYLKKLFPDRSREEIEEQEPFLCRFTTSPVFMDESRYGNFRFSFSLADVLQAYSTQFCGGQRPVLRIHKTVIYKKQVKYVVLIHSPDVHNYDDYPMLGDNDDGVCAYRDGEIIWRAQAISGTHKCRLIESREQKQIDVKGGWDEYYVWDNVVLEFHLPNHRILQFPREKLKKALTSCDGAFPRLNPQIEKLKAEEIVLSAFSGNEYKL